MEPSITASRRDCPSVIILTCGNPSRGDDALGSLFAERLERVREQFGWGNVELFTDFQLHIEHAVDLEGRTLALFVDASVSCPAPYQFTRLQPACDISYTSHALSPAAVLQVYAQVNHAPPPPAFQLAIRGDSFELGEPMSAAAEAHLTAALAFTVEQLLAAPDPAQWMLWAKK